MELLTDKLRRVAGEALPGIEAQYRMAPLHRTRVEVQDLNANDYRPSAVMVVFCRDQKDRLFIPLTERASYNGAHSGQVSLPGGKSDPSDIDLEATARRECWEEIGLKDVEVIGKLTPLFIPVSRFLVHPFIGVLPEKEPVMTHQEREVKRILRLYVDDLTSDRIIEEGTVEVLESLKIKTPWFNVNGYRVWGATAMILNELKELIKTIA